MKKDNPLMVRYGGILDDPDAFKRALARSIDRFVWAHHQRTDIERLRRCLTESGFRVQDLPWYGQGLRISGPAEGLGHHWATGRVSFKSRKPAP